ncbi:hypothetical protein LTR85_000549 [Meristemomyces frigidus]|nr:hypothetical protein LTR85_000549 [Meristemomyces frigidus]
MGKRKKSSRTPQGPKKREPLATSFKCVFCNNETSVSVQLDKKNHIGTLNCRQCGQNFQSKTSMQTLAQPIDIYYEWIDACEEVAKAQAAAAPASAPASAYRAPPASSARAGMASQADKYTAEDDGFIDDDDADADAEFAD